MLRRSNAVAPPFAPEEIVPFPATLARTPEATHCRGTLLVASRQTLKQHGHFERYAAALPANHATTIAASVAAVWLPIEVGIAHYRACDALNLPIDEQLTMGGEVVRNLQRTFIGTVVKAAG